MSFALRRLSGRLLTTNARRFGKAQIPLNNSARMAFSSVSPSQTGDLFSAARLMQAHTEKVPIVSEDTYVAANASVIGEVLINDKCTIWYGSVLRADVNKIEIGAYTTIYDNATLTVGDILPTGFPANLRIAEYSVVGHGAYLRSCDVAQHVMIGAGSTVLEGSVVESFARIEPGSVVPPGRVIPAGQVWGGSPARYIRNTTDEEKEDIATVVRQNYNLGQDHKEEFYLHRSQLHHQANAARRDVALAIPE